MLTNWAFVATVLIAITLSITPTLAAQNPVRLFRQEEANQIFKNKKQAVLILLGVFDQSSTQFEAAMQLSQKYTNILFTYSRKGVQPYQRLIELVGVQKLLAPIILYFSPSGDKYIFDGQQFGDSGNSKHVQKFINQASKGHLPIFMKSGYSREDIPDQQRQENEKYMKYYNAYSLEESRRHSQKDLIVVVYAFWCMYSEKFAPTFRELAKLLSVNPNLQFGKIDGSYNEIRNYEPTGYPLILHWGKDKLRPPTVYLGNRKLPDLVDWIRQATQHPWVQVQIKEQIKIGKVEDPAQEQKEPGQQL